MTRPRIAALALGIALTLGIVFAVAPTSRAQTSPPGSTADVRPRSDSTAVAPPSPASVGRAAVGRDLDRFEFGAALVDGPYDLIGTFGYHRYFRRAGPFEHWIHVELSGAKSEHVKEGAASVSYLLRPLRWIRRDWKIRPILEGGPGAHLVVQVVDVEGFGESAVHAKGYLKTHAFAGFETSLGSHWGLVARGRVSVPAHHPFDYAQIALFLR